MLRRAIPALGVAALVGWSCGAPMATAPTEITKAGSAVREALAASSRVRVIVSLQEPEVVTTAMSERSEAIAASRASVLSQLAEADFRLTHQWEHVAAVAGEVSREGLARLEAQPAVRRVDVPLKMKFQLAESVPLIHGDQARASGYKGRGVVIAMLDSGADTRHPDIKASVLEERCYCASKRCCPNGGGSQSGAGAAADDVGHGTHVAGIMVAPGFAQPVGVAPDAYIHAVRVGNDHGVDTEDAISGMNWVAGRSDVKVLNFSVGGGRYFSYPCDSADASNQAYASAINALWAHGVLTVVASGNEEYKDSIASPACVGNAVSVGAVYDSNIGSVGDDATTSADKVTFYSNSFAKLDFLAPGALIVSAGLGGGTEAMQGTSMAAPHVSGAAAVLFGAKPSLSNGQVYQALRATGRLVTDSRNGVATPRIDLAAALKAIQ
jgi:subtilisin family serine protease